jgi:hypothetical protein
VQYLGRRPLHRRFPGMTISSSPTRTLRGPPATPVGWDF